MTAPWGIVLDQNILGGVHNDLLPVEGDNLDHGLILAFRDGLTLDWPLEGAGFKGFNKTDEVQSSEIVTDVGANLVGKLELWDLLALRVDNPGLGPGGFGADTEVIIEPSL